MDDTAHYLYSPIPYFLTPSFIICDGINDLSEEQIKKTKALTSRHGLSMPI